MAFLDPTSVSFESDGIRYVNLQTLIELKLASGMTNPGRLKDLADVLELIKVLNLSDRFADSLNPFVQGKFRELWRQARKRFVTTWRGAALSAETRSHEDVVKVLRAASEQLAQMLEDGVLVDSDVPVRGDRVRLVTFDPQVAAK